jgi:hypothetical protein
VRPDENWLDDPSLANGFREIIQILLIESFPRLLGIGVNQRQWQIRDAQFRSPIIRGRALGVLQQGREASS